MGSVMCGRRGAVGSATAENVLAGKTFSSDKGVNIAGTMPDRGQWQYGRSLVHANGYYAMNQLPEGYYHADGADWAPEIRISAEDAKNSQMWKDAYNAGYNAGLANGRNDSPIHVKYVRSWQAGSSAGEINIRIIVTKNGRQVYDTGNFRPYNTASKEFDC